MIDILMYLRVRFHCWRNSFENHLKKNNKKQKQYQQQEMAKIYIYTYMAGSILSLHVWRNISVAVWREKKTTKNKHAVLARKNK